MYKCGATIRATPTNETCMHAICIPAQQLGADSSKDIFLLCVASLALIFSIGVSTGQPLTMARNSGRNCPLKHATHRATVAKGSRKECASHVTQSYSRAADRVGSSRNYWAVLYLCVVVPFIPTPLRQISCE